MSGEPTAEQDSDWPTMAFSAGDHSASMSSTGGGSGPGVPRRRLMNCCWSEENIRCASASLSAANTLTPTIA